MERLLKDWLESYLVYTHRSEPPILYKKWTAISVIAACLRRKCVLKWGTLKFYPNLYVILVGPSGKCRKGTAMGPGEDFLLDLGIKIASTSITREALIHQLKTSSDTSIDPITSQMHMHSSLTIFSKELTVFLGYNNQQLMADLTDWYDCAGKWEYRTKNMGTDDITGVWVNLIGATTPDLLQSTLPRDAIGGGLTSRMIFVYEDKKDHTEVLPILTDDEIKLADLLRSDLEKISMMQGEFKVSPKFIERWAEWYSRVDIEDPPFDDHKFAPYFERRPTHMFKLSMIMSASRSPDMIIEAEDFDKALALLMTTEIKMPYTFRGMGRDKNAESIHRMSTLIGHRKEVSRSELCRMLYLDADSKQVDNMISTLQSMEFCKIIIRGGESFVQFNSNYKGGIV